MRPYTRFPSPFLTLALVFVLSGFGGLDALFAPQPELWARWTAHEPGSTESVDHRPWDGFLRRNVTPDANGLSRLAYGKVSQADRTVLANYLNSLGAIKPGTLSRPHQKTYWINLYNALVVKLVLDHKPEKSIQDIDISPGLFSSGPWNAKLIEVEGEQISLNDIEHRILRPIWNDPRLHYAVNCASVGCPNLQQTAFTPEHLEEMLDHAARAYINSPRGVRTGPDGLVISKIYAWFQADFGGTEDGVRKHLLKYAVGKIAESLKSGTPISGFEYDWRLNSALP